ncbi:hypothetical protein D3C81_2049570 [compost metagenome]
MLKRGEVMPRHQEHDLAESISMRPGRWPILAFMVVREQHLLGAKRIEFEAIRLFRQHKGVDPFHDRMPSSDHYLELKLRIWRMLCKLGPD